jgi:hypothetical protein
MFWAQFKNDLRHENVQDLNGDLLLERILKSRLKYMSRDTNQRL